MKWKGSSFAVVEVLLENDLAMGDFVDACDEMIDEHWIVKGSPFTSESEDVAYICQAFIKRGTVAI